MAENSAISWTDHTFNPWWGCTKVGPGCDHCYAETFDRRVGGAHWGPGAPRRLVKDWSKPRKWDREAAKSGVRPWVFCASMADVFDNEVPSEWRDRLWDLVRSCRNLNWIFVTKRIGNAAKMLPADWPEAFPHCGLVITVVNQAEAGRDIPKLLATPAAWRGLSMEPLLGPVSLEEAWHGEPALDAECWGECGWCEKGFPPLHNCQRGRGDWEKGRSGLDWVIVGGESGHHARPMHPDWARSLRDQCAAAGVPFHFKQWGEWTYTHPDWPRAVPTIIANDGTTYNAKDLAFPDGARWGEALRAGHDKAHPTSIYRIGKRAAGRLLDGVEHNGMPHVAPAPIAQAAE